LGAPDSEDQPAQPTPSEKPAGYQPSVGRKVFMLVLCIVGLIVVWTYYFKSQKP
jgi:hypothetical protein